MSATTTPGRRLTSLPPVPLEDDRLRELADHPSIERVWVPDPATRAEQVYTLAGAHAGAIMAFWVERPDAYVKVIYEPADHGGLAWHRKEPTSKDEDVAGLIERAIENDYCPIEEVDDR